MNLEPVFTVTEFNEALNNHLARLGEVTVEGEISQIQLNNNHLIFLTIKDSHSAVNIFSLRHQITNFNSLTQGMLVRVQGNSGVYKKNTNFRIYASAITPSGEGALKTAYERLKKKLEAQGIFDQVHKKNLPKYPQNIGLITSKNSQAYQDFVKITRSRMGGLTIHLFSVNVQGNNAISQINKAISHFNNSKTCDVLVLTRGGGSLEDLIAFNDESVALTVFASITPIVCAIGHEGDVSLAELAADFHASTPSDAAYSIVADRVELAKLVSLQQQQIASSLQRRIVNIKTNSAQLTSRLHHAFHAQTQVLNTAITRIHSQHINLQKLSQAIHAQSASLLNSTLASLTTTLTNTKHSATTLHRLLASLGYQKTLRRGFSITTTRQGKIIRSISSVSKNQSLNTILSDGKIVSITTRKTTHP